MRAAAHKIDVNITATDADGREITPTPGEQFGAATEKLADILEKMPPEQGLACAARLRKAFGLLAATPPPEPAPEHLAAPFEIRTVFRNSEGVICVAAIERPRDRDAYEARLRSLACEMIPETMQDNGFDNDPEPET